jgi:hypothetical protein
MSEIIPPEQEHLQLHMHPVHCPMQLGEVRWAFSTIFPNKSEYAAAPYSSILSSNWLSVIMVPFARGDSAFDSEHTLFTETVNH